MSGTTEREERETASRVICTNCQSEKCWVEDRGSGWMIWLCGICGETWMTSEIDGGRYRQY